MRLIDFCSAAWSLAEVAFLCKFLEAAVFFGWVCDYVVVLSLIVKHRSDVCHIWCFDLQWVGLEVLLRHHVERKGRYLGVRLFLAMSQICYELADILLKLS